MNCGIAPCHTVFILIPSRDDDDGKKMEERNRIGMAVVALKDMPGTLDL